MKLSVEHIRPIAVITAFADPDTQQPTAFRETVPMLLDEGTLNLVVDLSNLKMLEGDEIVDMATALIEADNQGVRLALVIPKSRQEESALSTYLTEPLFSYVSAETREEAIETLILEMAEPQIEGRVRYRVAQASRRASLVLKTSYLLFLLSALMLLASRLS